MFAVTGKFFAPLALVLLPLGLCAQSKLLGGPPQPLSDGAPQPVIANSVGIAYPQYLWPPPANGGIPTVYYIIDPQSDPNATPNIQAAIATFNADFEGVIQWMPWSSALGPYYVDILLDAGNTTGQCESLVGYQATAGQLMGGATNCTIGTLLHEMGHVIGLWHEHQRADRATYVDVNYGNVIKGSWGNFIILTDNVQILSSSYDYASVMQYIPFAFSRNGGVVIESIPAGIPLAGYEGVPSLACPPGQTCPPYGPAVPVFDYSAGDKETIRRLYGAPPTTITVTSNPVGLTVLVDGQPVTTPQVYTWPLYSTHTLDVPTGVQTLPGEILNSYNPQRAATYYYTYGRWGDSTAQSHGISVVPGNGSPLFPSTAPALSTYSANFVQLVPYTAAISPVSSGSVAVSPQPQTYTGASGQFFVAREQVALTATPNEGWNFYEFQNAPYWLPGGLGSNPKTFYVPDTGLGVNTTVEFSNTPIYTVDVSPDTFSSGLYAYIDSERYYTPKNFSQYWDSSWTPNSPHSLQVLSVTSPYSVNSRYSFQKWSDGKAITHNIKLPATATNYIATLQPQFRPATYVNFPSCGGTETISPASPTGDGFYPYGQRLAFTATPTSPWLFAGWTFDLTGLTPTERLTADDETLVVANFNSIDKPLTLTGLTPSSAVVGGKAFTLKVFGTGLTPTNAATIENVYVDGTYTVAHYVSPTEITVPVTAAQIETAEGFQVQVENFPAGWNGCANFAYQTFLVTGAGPPTATPTFAPKAGTYGTAQNVAISDAVAGATIYYTTDGSTPTTDSPVYSTPIPVGATETLRALAEAPGYTKSKIGKAVYTID